ncbi:hypothetical protein TWF694_004417 [Orbilia ellipsospora]|uniref:Serine hydrolase domain-containing protein n=1 Tax=Orbilia ellipsospora TaxID=2528407 RepID=A0AAV9WV29_9PEZI
MHFLCLHGIGTNSKVFETQTAALRTELGGGHTYDFVEGTIPWKKAPELGSFFSDDDEYFAYYDPDNPSEMYQAMKDLTMYIEEEGPFDGILAFSHGACLASSLLIAPAFSNGGPRNRISNQLKFAVFIAGGIPACSEALRENKLEFLTTNSSSRISIPTAHIWASNDPVGPTMSAVLEALCVSNLRQVHVHNGGHTVPGRRSLESLRCTVEAVRRTIEEASSAAAS